MNDACPFIWRSGRTSTPGWCIGRTKYVMPRCFGDVPVGAGQQQAVVGVVRARAPQLLPVDDPLVAVALGARREPGEVGSVPGLAEQLAPRVLAGQDRPQEPRASRRRSRGRAASGPRARTRRRTACRPRRRRRSPGRRSSSAQGGRSRPDHARGHDGHAQPASTSSPRHSTSDSGGSHCSASHARTSARTASGVDCTSVSTTCAT